MLLPDLASALLVALAFIQAVPGTPALVDTVGRYISAYQQAFTFLVADEDTVQQVAEGGRVTATRHTRGELFAVFVGGDDVWMSMHDVAEVDGVAVGDRDDVRSLLSRTSVRAAARDIAEANARHNIGRVTRNFNEPMLALQLLASPRSASVAFDREHVDRSSPDVTLVTLRLRLKDDATFVASMAGRRVKTEGTVVVEAGTGRVRHTMLRLDDGQVSATLETDYARDDRLDLWVPTTFVEVYRTRRGTEVTTVRTTLSNYRRFEASGRIVGPAMSGP